MRSISFALAIVLASIPVSAFADPPAPAPAPQPAPAPAATTAPASAPAPAATPVPAAPAPAATTSPAPSPAAPPLPQPTIEIAPAAPAASSAAPAPAPAPAAVSNPAPFTSAPPEPDEPVPTRTAADNLFRLSAGARVNYVTDSGFDTFASNDVLTQFSLEGTVRLLHAGRASLAAGVAWDVGSRSDGIRGESSSLTVHRFTAPIEGRYALLPWLYAFGRVAPGANLLLTHVDDASSPDRLTDSAAAFAFDASAGVSFLVGPHAATVHHVPHIWITPEAGWSASTTASLGASPNRDPGDVLGTDAATPLRDVTASGFFWRISAAIGF